MKPAFPPDHHSHLRNRTAPPGALRDGHGRLWRADDIAAAAARGIAQLSRQCLPAFDPSDPREVA